jgi:hypothetical protein
MGNHVSRFYFFDLQKLEEGTDIREYASKSKRGGYRGGRKQTRPTAAGIATSTTAASRSSEDVNMTGTRKSKQNASTREVYAPLDLPLTFAIVSMGLP